MNFETLSSKLIAAQNRLKDFRHGGLVLTEETLEETIREFGEFARMARQLELDVARAGISRLPARTRFGGGVVALARRENVVPFGRPDRSGPDGGDAA
jgi:hypothetical protein